MGYLGVIRDHIARRDLGKAFTTDPGTQAVASMANDLLRLVDMAMQDEGVPADVRERVLRLVTYGALPNPADVERLQAVQSFAGEALSRASRPYPFSR